jgi:hypothetical protein
MVEGRAKGAEEGDYLYLALMRKNVVISRS